jgi:hypothetical protein
MHLKFYSKINNQTASVELVSPYMYKQIGIYGHRINSFRNSDLKTPELADNYELNSYILSTNNSGEWVNQSASYFNTNYSILEYTRPDTDLHIDYTVNLT